MMSWSLMLYECIRKPRYVALLAALLTLAAFGILLNNAALKVFMRLHASKTRESKDHKLCPFMPTDRVQRVYINQTVPYIEDLEKLYSNLTRGGYWTPRHCIPRYQVAIIIPYRNRRQHLLIFLQHMHCFLQKQNIAYGIYVIEELAPTTFNRAMLMNIGFVEANKLRDYDCVVFHDVDLLPEDLRNVYSCPDQPRHMSASLDIDNYKLRYGTLFGGVVAMRNDHFRQINGFSNLFFGWGGEDDDIYRRVTQKGLSIYRYPRSIARYTMVRHEQDGGNAKNDFRFLLYKFAEKRMMWDGLNSLNYTVYGITHEKLYTSIDVDFPEITSQAIRSMLEKIGGKLTKGTGPWDFQSHKKKSD